jgi:hypothetical protein
MKRLVKIKVQDIVDELNANEDICIEIFDEGIGFTATGWKFDEGECKSRKILLFSEMKYTNSRVDDLISRTIGKALEEIRERNKEDNEDPNTKSTK